MNVYRLTKNNDITFAFEIDNIYVSLWSVIRILESVDGVSDIRKRKLFDDFDEGVHILFRFLDFQCAVIEPFGDSSRYWIGPENPDDEFDFGSVEDAFRQYRVPFIVGILGDFISLDYKSFIKRFF